MDIEILRRTVLWDFLSRDLPEIPREPSPNGQYIKTAMKSAYGKFVFVCGDSFDTAEIDGGAMKLISEMREPAIYALSDDYHSPDGTIDEYAKEIVEEHRHDVRIGRRPGY